MTPGQHKKVIPLVTNLEIQKRDLEKILARPLTNPSPGQIKDRQRFQEILDAINRRLAVECSVDATGTDWDLPAVDSFDWG